jgi:hypothetical protein
MSNAGANSDASFALGAFFGNGAVGDNALLHQSAFNKSPYFANRSHPSAISPIICMIGLNWCHIASSIGTLVLSCSFGVPSFVDFFASIAPATSVVGSGTFVSITPSSSCSLFSGCSPAAAERVIWAKEETKLEASCSTASPRCFSGAPVREELEPRRPAFGFWRSPLVAETRAKGTGGKRNGREGGYAMRTMRVVKKTGTRKFRAQAMK